MHGNAALKDPFNPDAVGIYLDLSVAGGIVSEGQIDLQHVTLTDNVATEGMGGLVWVLGDDSTASANLSNSLLSGNPGGNSQWDALSPDRLDPTINFTGGNVLGHRLIVEDAIVIDGLSAADIFAALTPSGGGVLGDNGGGIPTVALKDFGAAIDAGAFTALPADVADLDADGNTVEALPVDARGFNRVVGLDPDLGAHENAEALRAATLVVDTLVDERDFDYSTGDLSLREALDLVADNGTITFASDLAGATITLAGTALNHARGITIDGDIDGDGIGDVTLDADGQNRVIESYGGVLSGLTITGGYLERGSVGNWNFGGGIYHHSGDLLLANSHVTGNSIRETLTESSAEIGGGGIVTAGNLAVVNSTISDNHVISDATITSGHFAIGGGLLSFAVSGRGSFVSLQNTTIAENTVEYTQEANSYIGGGAAFALYSGLDMQSTTITGNRLVTPNFRDTTFSAYVSAVADGFGDPAQHVTFGNSIVSGNGIDQLLIDPAVDSIQQTGGMIAGGALVVDGVSKGDVTPSDVFAALAPSGGGLLAAPHGRPPTAALNLSGPAVDADFTPDLPTDAYDIDANGNTVEPLPLDSLGGVRIQGPGLDLGAVEIAATRITSGGGADSLALAIAENQSSITDVDAIDDVNAEGAGLSYSLSGVDQALFGITPGTGLLFFLSAPDFETPLDSDADNTYEVDVTVTDVDGNSDTQSLAVTVTDVIEPGTTYVVTTLIDEDDGDVSPGDLSLREAISLANANTSPDVITFSQGGTIELTLGALELSSNVMINGDLTGDGVAEVTIDGGRLAGFSNRVIDVTGEDAEIFGLVVQGGSAPYGAGLRVAAGASLRLENATVTGNTATTSGGGIENDGTLSILHTTISSNTARFSAGGISNDGTLALVSSTISDNVATQDNGGGLQNGAGTATLINTTFANNGAGFFGAGVFNTNALSIFNSTFTGNVAAASGGGIYDSGSGPFSMFNSILTGNDVISTATSAVIDVTETYGGANNVVDNTRDPNVTLDVFADVGIREVGARLSGQLNDNGGFVQTVRITDNALVADAGSATNLPADALDLDGDGNVSEPLPRAANGVVRTQERAPDLGAYEAPAIVVEEPSLMVDTLLDVVDVFDGLTSLREALAYAKGLTGRDTITFDSTLAGGTIALSMGQLKITDDVTIQGDVFGAGRSDIALSGDVQGNDITTLDAFGNTISDTSMAGEMSDNGAGLWIGSGEVILQGVVVTGVSDFLGSGVVVEQAADLLLINSSVSGNIGGAFGGGLRSFGNLSLQDTAVDGNISSGTGGGLHVIEGTLNVVGGSISHNSADGGGGIESLNALITASGNGNEITISGTVLEGNTATVGAGGAIRARDALTLVDVSIKGNTAQTFGGGVVAEGVTEVTGSLIDGNRTVDPLGLAEGGGIYGADSLTILNTEISTNSSAAGGGVSGTATSTLFLDTVLFDGNHATDTGGAAFTSGQLVIRNGTFVSNRSDDIGGAISTPGSLPSLDIINSTFTGNSAATRGGALFAFDTTLANSIVIGNSAPLNPDAVAHADLTLLGGNILGSDVFSGDIDVGNISAGEVFDRTDLVLGVVAGRAADNGGIMNSVALQADLNNPALDAGMDSLLGDLSGAADGRGLLRFANIPGITGSDANIVDLGAFEMQVSPTRGPDILFGANGADDLNGLAGSDLIHAGSGRDILRGGAGNDTLLGQDGDDTLVGGAGDDLLNGGSGIDTVSYDGVQDRVAVFLNRSDDVGGGQGIDTFVSIENVIGTAFDDRINGNAEDNHLIGGSGDDILSGLAGNDTLDGGNGDDELIGAGGDDILIGGFGADRMFGLGGADTFEGGGGNDWIEGGLGVDNIEGGGGADDIFGFFGIDTIDGGTGNDNIRADGSGDIVNGNLGNDRIVGGNGQDTLWGGAGNDVLFGGGGLGNGDGIRDVFVFKSAVNGGGGFDIIRDFEDTRDKIDLSESGYTSFADVFADADQVGANVEINFDFSGVLRINDFELADLTSGDILF